MDKRPTGMRCKGEPSKGRINLGATARTQVRYSNKSTARTAQCACGELQHGIDYSTARTAQCAFRGATARRSALLTVPQHGTHGAVRTRGATARRSAQTSIGHSTARTCAGADRGATARAVRSAPRMYKARSKPGHYRSTAGHRATRARRNTQGTGTHSAHSTSMAH